MNQNDYKVSSISKLQKSVQITKDNHHQQEKEQKREQKQEEQAFRIEEKKEEHKEKSISTLWGIYNLIVQGKVKSEELTGSTLHDLLTVLMNAKKMENPTLMDQYLSFQNKQGIEKFSKENPQRQRTLNPKNYEKYKSFKEEK